MPNLNSSSSNASLHSFFNGIFELYAGFQPNFGVTNLPIYFPNPAASKIVIWNRREVNWPAGRSWSNQYRHNRGTKSLHLFVFVQKAIAITLR